MSSQRATSIVLKHADPQSASEELLQIAQREYHKRNGLGKEDPFKDDTTILVVDVCADAASRENVSSRISRDFQHRSVGAQCGSELCVVS